MPRSSGWTFLCSPTRRSLLSSSEAFPQRLLSSDCHPGAWLALLDHRDGPASHRPPDGRCLAAVRDLGRCTHAPPGRLLHRSAQRRGCGDHAGLPGASTQAVRVGCLPMRPRLHRLDSWRPTKMLHSRHSCSLVPKVRHPISTHHCTGAGFVPRRSCGVGSKSVL